MRQGAQHFIKALAMFVEDLVCPNLKLGDVGCTTHKLHLIRRVHLAMHTKLHLLQGLKRKPADRKRFGQTEITKVLHIQREVGCTAVAKPRRPLPHHEAHEGKWAGE